MQSEPRAFDRQAHGQGRCLLKTALSEEQTLNEGLILGQQWCFLASSGVSWASTVVPVMSWQQQHSAWGILSIIPQREPYLTLTHLPLSAHAFLWIILPFFLFMPSPQQHLWKICSSCLLSPQFNSNLCFHFSLPLPDSLRVSVSLSLLVMKGWDNFQAKNNFLLRWTSISEAVRF